jgi:hypothetical protein
MTCQAFLDRLYDEDARAAARGVSPVPADMAGHMLGCADCRAAYDAARADEQLLVHALRASPPPGWRADVLRQIARPRRSSWTQIIATTNDVVTWGILAIAASRLLPGESSIAVNVAAFLTGGAAAILYPGLEKPWMLLFRSPHRQ